MNQNWVQKSLWMKAIYRCPSELRKSGISRDAQAIEEIPVLSRHNKGVVTVVRDSAGGAAKYCVY
jgi:hypothetical protein